jgi:hypothetical protein
MESESDDSLWHKDRRQRASERTRSHWPRNPGSSLVSALLLGSIPGRLILEAPVPKYVIEREIPGAGKLTAPQLEAISQTSCGVLQNLGPQIQWVQSYVTDNKIYCVYIAPNVEMIREHARQGQFPANHITEVKSVIDPTTAEPSLG